MGADGDITIYDYDILCSIMGEESVKNSTSPAIYIHEIFGKKVVTVYHGDNIWCNDCLVCGLDEGRHVYENKKDDNGKIIPVRDDLQTCLDKIKPAFLARWEVWT